MKNYWQDERATVFLAVSLGWFLSIGVRLVYPVLLPFLRSDFGFSLTIAGSLLTVLWLSYAVGQIPGGVMGDRFGEGSTMAVSMSIAVVTVVLIVGAGSVVALFVGTSFLGFAIALFGVVRLTALADIFPNNIGTVHGLVASAGDISKTVLPPLAGFIAAVAFWQLSLGILVPLFVLAAVTLRLFVPSRTSSAPDGRTTLSVANVRRVLSELRRPELVLVTAIQIFGLITFQAFTGFYPTYLIEVKGLSPTLASGLFSLFFALGIGIKPLAGTAYDRISVRWTLAVVTGASALGFAALPYVDGFWRLAAVTAVVSLVLGRGTVALSYMTVSIPQDVQNMGIGILRTVYQGFGAMSPVLFGAIADHGYFDEGFLLLAMISGIILLIVVRLPAATPERTPEE